MDEAKRVTWEQYDALCELLRAEGIVQSEWVAQRALARLGLKSPKEGLG